MAGFEYRKNIDGSKNSPTLMYGVGKNSVTFSKGDLVRINTSGFADIATGGEGIVGVLVTVVDSDGKRISNDSGTTGDWTMASDNQTSDQYEVAYIPALSHYLFYNDADDSLTRTMEFQYFDANDENDVDVNTATDTYSKQVQLISRDPDGDGDASKGLFRIVESQFSDVGVDNAS